MDAPVGGLMEGKVTHVPDPSEALQAVEDLMQEAIADVDAQWRRVLDGTTDEILGELDLPRWLAASTGGKRLRPLMCHWGFVCGAGRPEAYPHVVRCGAALELLHTFALIHDDVMDESDTRRGAPSAHRRAGDAHARRGGTGSSARYGESMAILLGDLAHAIADSLVADTTPRVARLWFELNVELIAGQREDLSGAATGAGDLARARRIARIKSGAYTVTRPLQLGAAVAGAGPEVAAALEGYGDELGGVFAARDDLLGVWGDPAETGKPSGDDLRLRKPTTLWVDAERVLRGEGRRLLERVGTPDERPGDVAALQEAMVAAGVRERAELSITGGVDRAVTALTRAEDVLHPDGVDGLVHMAHRVAWRSS